MILIFSALLSYWLIALMNEHLVWLWAFLTISFYWLFSKHSWKFLNKKPNLEIYQNGIRIDELGFYEWSKIKIYETGNSLVLLVDTNFESFKIDLVKTINCTNYGPYKDSGLTALQFDFPNLITNISVKTFRQHIKKYAEVLNTM